MRFRVLTSDDIRGEMIWRPYQKDGATGTLTGKMISDNEIQFLYDYLIEGNRQSETCVMKIDDNVLSLKKGELTEDPANPGNMTYKNAGDAVYTDVLQKINCQ